MELYCIPCKKAFLNENSFVHHKKGKWHISAVNNLKGNIPKIDMIDKSMFKDEEEEQRIKWISFAEFMISEMKSMLTNVVIDT